VSRPMADDALKRAGILLKGKPPLVLNPGELLALIGIDGRPVPWKAPTTTRTGHSFKDKRLVAWQKRVADEAAEVMRVLGRDPYAGPVSLSMCFELKRKAGRAPDTSNLGKAAEDALQGVVIVNDTQVGFIESKRIIGDRDYCTIGVYAKGRS
jgi:Holliday junction resolvase RusA-like endonuclease